MRNLISTVINLYILIVIVRVAISWIGIDSNNQFVRVIIDITEPPLAKIRSVVPLFGGLDLSPIVLIVALSIIRNLLFPGY